MKYIIFSFFSLLSFTIYSRSDTAYYRSPLDIPLSLSANFGELRSNHLHSGVDFRVGGVPGAKLYAVADGYVARIVVRPDGFGNALYIQHPNGTISVYGHMEAFSPTIKNYIEQLQYARQRFSVDIEPSNAELIVKKGSVIGTAGNTGTSFGAHLHFELRDSESQHPLNIITRKYYATKDNFPPVIQAVHFYEYSEENKIPEIKKITTHTASKGKQTILVSETFYVAIDCKDQINDSPAKLAVNRLIVSLDKDTIFAYRIDEFSFEESPYINSMIAYEELQQKNGVAMIKTYVEPGNHFTRYEKVANHGLITLCDTNSHLLSITAIDDYGNKTVRNISIKRNKPAMRPTLADSSCVETAVWNRNNYFTREGLSVNIPTEALFRSVRISIDSLPSKAESYSTLWRIHRCETPLIKNMQLHIKATVPDSLHDKALIAMLSPNGIYASVGGQWANDGVKAACKRFGTFFVTVDTLAPTIKTRFSAKADLRKSSKISIRITDNLSGIASYNGYIDGEWALFSYDAKSNTLSYVFNQKYLRRNTEHRLQLVVTDNKQNTATLNTSFLW